MKVHEIITALAGEDPNANVVVNDHTHGYVHLDGFEGAQDMSNGSIVPTFMLPNIEGKGWDNSPEPFDVRFDDSTQGSRTRDDGNTTVCYDHSDTVEGCPECKVEQDELHQVKSLASLNRRYNTHYANVAGDHGADCECAARCAFCAATHYPTDHGEYPNDDQLADQELGVDDYHVSNRWHIDDVKHAIAGNDWYKDEPMPSDQALFDYLQTWITNDYWVGAINESLDDQLGELFPEVYAVKMAAFRAESSSPIWLKDSAAAKAEREAAE